MSARFDLHIETRIQDEIFNTDIPAVVMGKVSKSGDMSFYSNGPSRWDRDDSITPQNIFSIASMTKVLTSVAALQLVEQKQVTLDQPLDQHLPEMSERLILNEDNKVIEPQNSITLRHLLTHTAGFGYWFTSPQLGRWNQLKAEINWTENYQPRLFESGTSFMYGTNIDWVGRLVEKISGIDLEQYFRQYISGPLGMDSTWYNVPNELEHLVVATSYRNADTSTVIKNEYQKMNPIRDFNGGGGLSSSPEDYGRFLACMLNKGTFNNVKLLEESTFDLLNSPQLNNFKTTHRYVDVTDVDTKYRGDKDYFFDSHDNWTLAWAYEENSVTRPMGTAYWSGIFNTYFTIDFENEFALVYMTQILPFNDMNAYNLLTSFERIIYDSTD
ncbi:MAG: serine hydrolase domain-containing protein [Candidatus Poribacteria bacterium]|nr:serine hydrolase domain-containing protein [Candidatus Poribacteria bacterium]